jgi:glycosyltransferase involved in cell wall biosynthesis
MKHFFILVPSPSPTGPVKGALALANALVATRRVTLVFLKDGPGADERVCVLSLANQEGGWLGRLNAYRAILRQAGPRINSASISMCLSADLINRFCGREAVTCASIRGNLPANYRYDYGWRGGLLALGHLHALRGFDHVIAMSDAMAGQIRKITGLRSTIVRNFVDESALDPFRTIDPLPRPARFIFVGSLSQRKQPDLVVDAFKRLADRDAELDILGTGPLREGIESQVKRHDLQDRIRIHGQVANPYPLIARSDVFVLPSRSEGISRAALEALHLGVPCVLRSVDGNAELLADPDAGALFLHDNDLAGAMQRASDIARQRPSKSSLLPYAFRQGFAADQYRAILESSH